MNDVPQNSFTLLFLATLGVSEIGTHTLGEGQRSAVRVARVLRLQEGQEELLHVQG